MTRPSGDLPSESALPLEPAIVFPCDRFLLALLEFMKNRQILDLIIIMIPIILALVVLQIVSSGIAASHELSPTYLRQIEAASSLPLKIFPGVAGFWHWRLPGDFSSGLYISYPSFAYLPLSLLIQIGLEGKVAFAITSVIFYSSISLAAFLLGYNYINKLGSVQLFSILGGLLLSVMVITQPTILNILTDPNWEDSFVLFSLVGFSIAYANSILAMLSFACAAFTCPSAGLAACLFCAISFSLSFHGVSRSSCRRLSLFPLIKSAYSLLDPLLKPLLGSIAGILCYLALRIILASTLGEGASVSGSSLTFRMGLDEESTNYYGGLVSMFRILFPISGLPKGLFDFDRRSVSNLLLLFEFALLSLGSLSYVIRRILCLAKGVKPNSMQIVLLYFAFITICMVCIFPNWSAVHFRLLARLYAPCMSISLWHVLISGYLRLTQKFKTDYGYLVFGITFSCACWIVSSEFLRFFYVWNLPFWAQV